MKIKTPFKWIRVDGNAWHRLAVDHDKLLAFEPIIQDFDVLCNDLPLRIDTQGPIVDLIQNKPKYNICRACKRADRKRRNQ